MRLRLRRGGEPARPGRSKAQAGACGRHGAAGVGVAMPGDQDKTSLCKAERLERVPFEWNGSRSTFLRWRMPFFGKPASTFPGHALGACPCNGFLLHGEARVRFTAFHEQDLSSVGRRTAVAFATVCS